MEVKIKTLQVHSGHMQPHGDIIRQQFAVGMLSSLIHGSLSLNRCPLHEELECGIRGHGCMLYVRRCQDWIAAR